MTYTTITVQKTQNTPTNSTNKIINQYIKISFNPYKKSRTKLLHNNKLLKFNKTRMNQIEK